MNDTEATKTIQQMVRFIKLEAEEKASEIEVATEEEFNITKLQLLEAEKAKVRKEYERKEKAVEVKKKVEYSKQLNESRLRVLQARHDAVEGILKDAQKMLLSISERQGEYEALMLDLMVQGMKKLGEQKARVVCRSMDVALVQRLIPQAMEKYSKLYGIQSPHLEMETGGTLPPPPQNMQHAGELDAASSCSGGVVITSADGKVVCNNTLDDRLRIAHLTNLPAIRSKLFGEIDI